MESTCWAGTLKRASAENTAVRRTGTVRKSARKRAQIPVSALYFGLIGLMLFTLVLMLSNRRYTVEGASMEPSLREGDILYYTGFQTYGYGDLIIFQGKEEYGMLVKRVIGLPGDRIQISSDGSVTRNNVLLEESYAKADKLGNSAMREITVGEGMLFVLGDNRAESIDSRDARVGQISLGSVHGKVEKIVRLEDGRADK